MSIYIYVFYVFILLSLYRLFIGPTIYDRLMAFHVVQSCAIIIISLYAVIYDISFYLDIAMVFSLLSFCEVIAFNKFYAENDSGKTEIDFKENLKDFFKIRKH